jgi:nitrate/nitrite-specific signal transduction histidine kinase
MALFGQARDISMFRYINRELMQNIISQQVVFYKYKVAETKKTSDFLTNSSIDTSKLVSICYNIFTSKGFNVVHNRDNGTIEVILKNNNFNCILIIKDDGIGMPESIQKVESTSMGMELIHILAEQLGADLKIIKQNGTQFILQLDNDIKENFERG